jgi:homoserine kinase type II
MSVFTRVTGEELSVWLKGYAIGTLRDLKGIAEGIENTNYFVTTTHGRFVLTLFEKLTAAELPSSISWLICLAAGFLPRADRRSEQPISRSPERQTRDARHLPGAPVSAPQVRHCESVGALLADMHLAGRGYDGKLENPRGPKWWREAAPRVEPFLDPARRELLASELEFQARHRALDLPRGPVHADLFRDNVLFDEDRIGGVIDFYFAGLDAFVFDVAVAVNDWCIDPAGEIDPAHANALLAAYRGTRELTSSERKPGRCFCGRRRCASGVAPMRLYLPRAGELVHARPEHFRRVLEGAARALLACLKPIARHWRPSICRKA